MDARLLVALVVVPLALLWRYLHMRRLSTKAAQLVGRLGLEPGAPGFLVSRRGWMARDLLFLESGTLTFVEVADAPATRRVAYADVVDVGQASSAMALGKYRLRLRTGEVIPFRVAERLAPAPFDAQAAGAVAMGGLFATGVSTAGAAGSAGAMRKAGELAGELDGLLTRKGLRLVDSAEMKGASRRQLVWLVVGTVVGIVALALVIGVVFQPGYE